MGTKRVYWKTLREKLHDAERFIEEHDEQLEENLVEDVFACVVDTLQAIQTCLGVLPQNTPDD